MVAAFITSTESKDISSINKYNYIAKILFTRSFSDVLMEVQIFTEIGLLIQMGLET